MCFWLSGVPAAVVVKLKPKLAEMFDNVLADTETAFQGVGKALARALPPSTARGKCATVALPLWAPLVYLLMLAATVVAFLPSFFTLLVLRTTKVETDSEAFGQRQAVIMQETCGRKTLRVIAVRHHALLPRRAEGLRVAEACS